MKFVKSFLIFVLISAFIPLAFGDAVFKSFRLDPGKDKVHLIWEMSTEAVVKEYKIKRGFTETTLNYLAKVKSTPEPIPFGSAKKYEFIDTSLFKNLGRTFYYQIVVIDSQNKEITASSILQVSPQISSVRHTWGSIKYYQNVISFLRNMKL